METWEEEIEARLAQIEGALGIAKDGTRVDQRVTRTRVVVYLSDAERAVTEAAFADACEAGVTPPYRDLCKELNARFHDSRLVRIPSTMRALHCRWKRGKYLTAYKRVQYTSAEKMYIDERFLVAHENKEPVKYGDLAVELNVLFHDGAIVRTGAVLKSRFHYWREQREARGE